MTLPNPFRVNRADMESQSNPKGPEYRISSDLVNTGRFFYVFAILCFLGVAWHCGFTRAAATPLLWALACVTVGAGFGFLFGIPKIFQSNTPVTENPTQRARDYRQQVNTNLTEISDWLTKIIVGLGLINLKSIPPFLNSTAEILARTLDQSDSTKEKSFALAILVCFPIIGFLFGYLSTRLFLQAAFSRADQEAATLQLAEQVASIEAKQELVYSVQDLRMPETINTDGQSTAAANRISRGEREPEDPITALRQMAAEYLNISVSDKSERILLKNTAARDLFNYAIQHQVSKDSLVAEAEKDSNEGLVLTLANLVLDHPEKGDFDRISRVAQRIKRWHVQYRIVQAIGQVFERHCANVNDVESAQTLLTLYEQTADRDLQRRIRGTSSLLERIVASQQSES